MNPTLNAQQFDELKDELIDSVIDTMSLDNLINYVSEDLERHYRCLSSIELIEEAGYHFGADKLDGLIKNICSKDRLTNVQQ